MAQKKRIHPEVRRRAGELRLAQTPAEQKVWRVLRSRQCEKCEVELNEGKEERENPKGE